MLKNLRFSWIAWHFAGLSVQKSFGRTMSLACVVGLMLSVATLVIVLAVLNGFEQQLHEKILGLVPHAQVQPQNQNLLNQSNWTEKANELKKFEPHLIQVSPYHESPALLMHNGTSWGVQWQGIDATAEKAQKTLTPFWIRDELDGVYDPYDRLAQTPFGVIMSQYLASRLGLVVGDQILIAVPKMKITPMGSIPRYKRFTLVGLFNTGAELDTRYVFSNIQDMDKLLGDKVPALSLKLAYDEVLLAPELTPKLARFLGSQWKVTDWSLTQGQFFEAVKIERFMISFLLFLLVLVAGFNLVSALMMMVQERSSDIAILQTIGFTLSDIQRIFLFQGLGLAFLGLSLGLVLGFFVSYFLQDWTLVLYRLTDWDWLGILAEDLPIRFIWTDFIGIGILVFILTLISAIAPALKVSKINPVKQLTVL